jgi:hypothetical protein
MHVGTTGGGMTGGNYGGGMTGGGTFFTLHLCVSEPALVVANRHQTWSLSLVFNFSSDNNSVICMQGQPAVATTVAA